MAFILRSTDPCFNICYNAVKYDQRNYCGLCGKSLQSVCKKCSYNSKLFVDLTVHTKKMKDKLMYIYWVLYMKLKGNKNIVKLIITEYLRFNIITTRTCPVISGLCGHTHHEHCLLKWKKTQETCPLDIQIWTELFSVRIAELVFFPKLK
jgi:hypothetical protein